MRKFLIQEDKSDFVVNYLTQVNKLRKYDLYLISCYIDKQFPFDFIKSIVNTVNLKNINIYIDRNEVYRVGQKEIKKLLKRIKISISMRGLELNVNLCCVKGYPGIFHSKAYMLINYDSSNEIKDGAIVVGSANLSKKGLSNIKGNFETLIGLKSKSDLKKFTTAIEDLNSSNALVDFDNISSFQDITIENEFSWQYSILKSGYFVHRWSNNLRNELSVKFYLSKQGQKTVQTDELKELGFSVETKTISKNYFKFSFPKVYLGNVKDFLKFHGLETYMGHWIPKAALTINDNDEFNSFKKKLEAELYEQKEDIKRRIFEDREKLLSLELILPSYQSKMFTDKHIQNLLSNQLTLYRIYTKYHISEFSLDYSQTEEIDQIYEELISTLESKKKNWPACNALNTAIKNLDAKILIDEELYNS